MNRLWLTWFLLIIFSIVGVYFLQKARAEGPLSGHENPDGSYTIILTPEESKACDSGGGCVMMSRNVFREVVQQMVLQKCGRTL